MMPSSLTKVHLKVCCSVLYGALLAAELLAWRAPEALFSSTKTSVMKLLMTEGLIGAHLRDHTTTPEVVTISKVSNIVVGVVEFGLEASCCFVGKCIGEQEELMESRCRREERREPAAS